MSRLGTQRTFYKDLQQLYKTVESSTDDQAEILGIDEMTQGVHKKTIFYFLETLCDSHHNEELGNLSSYLFSGVKLREYQSNSDTCQTSSSCCWYPVYDDAVDYSYVDYGEYESSLDLEYLFKINEPFVAPGEISVLGHLKIGLGYRDYIFGGLFFERERGKADSECFLFKDDDSYQGSDGFGRLFNFENLEEGEERGDYGDDATAVDTLKMEIESDVTENDEEVSEDEVEVEIHVPENIVRDDAQSISTMSTDTYYEEYRDILI
ncbi:unnamed protein product [Rodentolepis nana]|uniref:DUF5063 domain-containing protein n=1 Tax=Rodentolepis nana TaxID=102285 RepID=A0A0R3TYT2_RODNA|nr:unnamed protein product [Rodentolepis nana]